MTNFAPYSRRLDPRFGGAAMEYVIVSTFAMMLAIAAVTYVSHVFRSKMGEMEKHLGISFDELSLEILPIK